VPILHDGREVSSTDPEWAQECLARHVLAMQPLAARRAWLADHRDRARAMPDKLTPLEERILAIHATMKKPPAV
jgi:hypothetical protein